MGFGGGRQSGRLGRRCCYILDYYRYNICIWIVYVEDRWLCEYLVCVYFYRDESTAILLGREK